MTPAHYAWPLLTDLRRAALARVRDADWQGTTDAEAERALSVIDDKLARGETRDPPF